MQTVKVRARYLGGPGGLVWELSHPQTTVRMWATLTHDGAVELLEKFVLANQIEAVLS